MKNKKYYYEEAMKQFIKFLKRHGVYAKYMYYFYYYPLYCGKYHPLSHTEDKWILLAFDWECTKEGVNFWRNLNCKWMEEIYR